MGQTFGLTSLCLYSLHGLGHSSYRCLGNPDLQVSPPMLRLPKALLNFSFLATTICSAFLSHRGVIYKIVKTPLEIIYVLFPIDKIQNPKIKILSKFRTKEKLP